jgi:hypothetical protein
MLVSWAILKGFFQICSRSIVLVEREACDNAVIDRSDAGATIFAPKE